MDTQKKKPSGNNLYEIFYTLLTTITFACQLILFSLLLGEILPRSEQLIPPLCDYGQGWFYTVSDDGSTTSVKLGDNQTITQTIPTNVNGTRSVYVSQNNEIWTINPSTSEITISKTLGLDIIHTINLGTIDCFAPGYIVYDSRAYKKQGQVWVTCTASDKVIIINPTTYSSIGEIEMPSSYVGNTIGPISIGPNYAFVVYSPNRWIAYSTKTPTFSVVTSGFSPGGTIYDIISTWRSNTHSSSANLYVSTTQKKIFKYAWDGSFDILGWTEVPSPVIINNFQDITTSPDEKFLYALVTNSPGLWAFTTSNMAEVPGSGTASSVTLPSPTSFSIATFYSSWQMLVTQSNGDVSSLIYVNPKTGIPSVPPDFTYVQTGTGCENVAYYIQQCPCEFC